MEFDEDAKSEYFDTLNIDSDISSPELLNELEEKLDIFKLQLENMIIFDEDTTPTYDEFGRLSYRRNL